MEKKEIKALESKSLLAAIYYLEQDELSSSEHENIKSQLLKTIYRKNIAFYNNNSDKVNSEMTNDISISKDFLQEVRKHNNGIFHTEDYFYKGIFFIKIIKVILWL